MIDLTTEDAYVKRVGNLCSDCSVLTASILSDINQVFYSEGLSGDLLATNLSVRYVTGQEYHDLVMGISGTFEPKTVYVISNDASNFYAALDEKRNINDLQYRHDEWQLETNDGDTAILVKSGNMYVGNSTKYFPQQYALLYAGNDNWQLAAPQFSTYLAKIAAETTYKLVFQRDDITFTVSRGDTIALMSQVITSNDISTCMHYYHSNETPKPPHVGDSTFLNGIYSIYDGEEWRRCKPDTIPTYITDSNGNAISADRSCVDAIPIADTVWHIEADITTPFVSHYEGDATYTDDGWSYTDPFGSTIHVGCTYNWQREITRWQVYGAMTFADSQSLAAQQILVEFQVDGDKFTESIVHDNITLARTAKTNTKLATVSQVNNVISGKADLSALDVKRDLTDLGVRGTPISTNDWFIVNGERYVFDDIQNAWVGEEGIITGSSGTFSYTFYGIGISGQFILDNNYEATSNGFTFVGYTDTIAKVSEIPDVSGKADKAVPSSAGNLASLNAQGNLVDSGVKASDFATKSDLPYRLATPGKWEFSGGVYGQGYYIIISSDGQGGYNYALYISEDNTFITKENKPTDGVLSVFFEAAEMTATRPSLPGHLLDRANNLIDATTGKVTLTLPPFVAGKVRNLLVACTIGLDGNDKPWSVIFQGADGEEISFKAKGDDAASATFPVPTAAGDWWYLLTEYAPHVFMISLKQLQNVSQQRGV